MKQLLTGADHDQLERELWDLCKGLPLSRRDRLLWRNKLYLDWLAQFRAAQEREEAAP